MMTLDEGITSDGFVISGRPYLARLKENHYLVVYPQDPIGEREVIPYKEAEYKYMLAGQALSYLDLAELAQIF